MSTRALPLYGREHELGEIVRFLGAGDGLPGSLVLQGEAGIGKTTLWLSGVEAARSRYRVLTTRPSEAAARFSFAGLSDLLGASAGEVLPGLPPVQRRALEAALLLGEAETSSDGRAVAAACLGALRLLAAESPVCLAIDDIQWLDAATLATLRYAFDRLDGEPIAALITVRGGLPDWLRRNVPYGRVRVIELGSLGIGAVRALLRSRLGATFARPALVKLVEASGGNPFFVLELAAALLRSGGTVAPGAELPIPSGLGELMQKRLDILGRDALDVAYTVAALGDPIVSIVESANGRRTEPGLAEAVAALIIERDGERLRFTHPLLRSAVVARQTPARGRRLHARLASIVRSTEEQARHLAFATPGPDPDVAAVLEAAARSVHVRGALAAAAELADQAVRLTPVADQDEALRRLLVATDWHRRAGDAERATELLTRALASAPPGDAHARILTHLADIQHPPTSIPRYHQALAEAVDEELRAAIHIRIATGSSWDEGVEQRLHHAELAVRVAARLTDPAVRCRALAALGTARFYAGYGIATELMNEAMVLERSLAQWPLDDGPTYQFGAQLFWSAEVEPARDLFREMAAAARAREDPAAEAEALWFLGFLAWRQGDWDEADRLLADSMDLRLQLGSLAPPDEFPAAVLAAHRGQVGAARDRAQTAIARAKTLGIRIAESGHGWVLGFVELSLADANAALEHLRRTYEIRNTFMLEPAQRLELGDLLEALITVGELDEAEGVLATWEPRATALDRPWALAILARGRALLLATRGDFDAAFSTFDQALAQHARCQDPFQHARTLLALGRTMRRANQRRAARATLEDAHTRFERLGAALWVAQALGELGRISGRRRPATDELTEAERRIATLVAEGRPNREVAATLFLTEHSVETALTRIYRKLDIRSRTALAALRLPKA